MKANVTVEGAVDIHGHSGPSLFERRVDGFEFARLAAEAGMDAIVIKHHYLPSVYGVPYINRLLEREGLDIEVIGSVVLNYCNGGFNPFMVQTAIEMGAKVVWFPTIDARNHGEKSGGIGQHASLGEGGEIGAEYAGKRGLFALAEDGELKDDVKLCIEKIVRNDVVLSTGHVSFEEADRVLSYAADLGHDKMVVDHPKGYMTDFSMSQQETLIGHGAYLNYLFAHISPKFHSMTNEAFYGYVSDLGVENCVVSSDMGQIGNPHSPDALEMLGEILLEEGLTREEYRTLVEENPKRLLGLADA